jgi:hypothetical protein
MWPTVYLRFHTVEGKKILQQWWSVWQGAPGPSNRLSQPDSGEGEWRDVQIVESE